MRFDPDHQQSRTGSRIGITISTLSAICLTACARLEPAPAHSRAVDSAQPVAAAATIPVNTDENKLALDGYDPVSYFDAAKPLKGSPQITTTDRGAIYRFASEEHRKLFVANPQKYEPAYGGYCAYGIAHGYKVACDPTNYKLEGGKLFLFNKTLLLDASKGWTPQQKKVADQNWERATGR